jgi:hypothetical protein
MMEDATRMEEAARAAMRAAAGTVSDAPPLHLPPLASPVPRRRRRREPGQRRRRAQWLVPLAAAACVIAIAAGLVSVRQVQNGPASPRPLPSSAMPATAAPDYYVALSHPPDEATPNQVIVGSSATGHVLSRVSPPAGTTFSGVAGAADDRTFVLETQPFPQPLPARTTTVAGDGYTAAAAAVTLPRTWYLLRVSPSASPAAQLVRIPVPVTPAGQEVTALALSPDGSKLALAMLPHLLPQGYKGVYVSPQLLRVYSVATGAVLRTWSTTRGSIDSYDFTPDSGTSMSWQPDGNHLAVFVDSDSPGLHLLDVRSPGGDLASPGPGWALYRPGGYTPLHVTSVPDPHYVAW